MYRAKLLENNGKNNNYFEPNIESKKRKMDENFNNSDSLNTSLIIVEGNDKHEYALNKESDLNTDYNTDTTLQTKHDETNSTLNNNTPIIPKAIENDNNVNKHSEEVKTIGWRCLLERISGLEEKISDQLSSEIASLKRSWQANVYELKHAQDEELKQLTLQVDQLKQKNARYEEQKHCLINDKVELEKKLKQEQSMRLKLFGILSKDTEKLEEKHNLMLELFENFNSQQVDNSKNIALHSILETENNEAEKLSQNSKTHDEYYPTPRGQYSRIENNQDSTVPTPSIRDKKPPTMSTQKLGDEIRNRRERRNNIIMKGMRPSTGNLMDDTIKLIQRKTGIMPQIKELKVIKSGILLKMNSLANKLEIIRRSGSLRVLDITLEDDLTARERLVQNWLKEIEAEDRKLGKNTVATFFKIKQDGVWKVWNERLGDLVIDERMPLKRFSLHDSSVVK